jgi:hypothetical protein
MLALLCYKTEQFDVELFCGDTWESAGPTAEALCGVHGRPVESHTGIDDKTLRKHFRQELDTAAAKANSVIGSRLYAAAERGEPWAVCFWLKTRGRWRETSTHEHTGPDGKPIEQQLKIVVTGIRPTEDNT